MWIVYTDNNQDVWLLNAESGKQRVISTTREWSGDIAWSPDSRWVAFVQAALNSYAQIALYNVGDKRLTMLTSDRVNSFSPTWDPAGNWLYFLSDRHLQSLVTHPWGPRQPEPYFDKPVEIYQVALRTGLRSPFRHTDELYDDNEDEEQDDGKKEEEGKIEPIALELEGIEDPLALVLDRLVVFIMDGGWGEEPQAGVIMFVVIPLEKGLTPGACIFQ